VPGSRSRHTDAILHMSVRSTKRAQTAVRRTALALFGPAPACAAGNRFHDADIDSRTALWAAVAGWAQLRYRRFRR
jgi:hypothetical protein